MVPDQKHNLFLRNGHVSYSNIKMYFFFKVCCHFVLEPKGRANIEPQHYKITNKLIFKKHVEYLRSKYSYSNDTTKKTSNCNIP